MHLVAYGNTYNACLLILRDRGYELHAEEGVNSMVWIAVKGDDSFVAYSPPELLGIVTLGEEYGPDWNRHQPNILRSILEEPDPE
jgi:hypothetical protein